MSEEVKHVSLDEAELWEGIGQPISVTLQRIERELHRLNSILMAANDLNPADFE